MNKRTIFTKEDTKLFRNSKNKVAMITVNKFRRKFKGSIFNINMATRITKTTFTSERHLLKRRTMGTKIKCMSKSRISTMNNFMNFFKNNRSKI